MEKIAKLNELIKENKYVQRLIAKRDLDSKSSLDESIVYTQGLAAGLGLDISSEEVEEYLTKARLLISNEGGQFKNLPKEFLNIKVGIVNKGTHMCQSCVPPTAIGDDSIFQRIRKLD